MAIVQPVLSALGESAELFVFYRARRGDLLLFGVLLVFVPPLLLWAAVLLLERIGPGVGRIGFLLACGVLGAVLAMQISRELDITGVVYLVPAAVVGGVAVAALMDRVTPARQWVSVLAPAGIVFALLFWFTSAPARVVRESDGPAAVLASAESKGDAAPVAVLMLDEFPTRSIVDPDLSLSSELVPNLARFAEDATWYRGHLSVADKTNEAVPAFLTGRRLTEVRDPLWFDYPANAFELLSSTHELHVSEAITQVCPPRLCPLDAPEGAAAATAGSADDGDSGLPPWRRLLSDARTLLTSRVWPWNEPGVIGTGRFTETAGSGATAPSSSPSSADVLEQVRFKRFFAGLQGSQPTRMTDYLAEMPPTAGSVPFYFLHLVVPHSPWVFRPDGTDRGVVDMNFLGRHGPRWESNDYPVAVARSRHLDQVAYTDKLIGAFLERLKDLDLYDEATIVVVADHGVSFIPGTGDRDAEPANLVDVLPTPLFVKYPGTGGRAVSEDHVEIVDVLSWIADPGGFTIPWEHDGVPAGERGDELQYLSEQNGVHTVSASGVLSELAVLAADPVTPGELLAQAGVDAAIGQPAPGGAIGQVAGPLPDHVTAQVDSALDAVGLVIDDTVVAAGLVADEGRVVVTVPIEHRGGSGASLVPLDTS